MLGSAVGAGSGEEGMGPKLHAVLNVIDQSLHALKSQQVVSAATSPGGGSATIAPGAGSSALVAARGSSASGATLGGGGDDGSFQDSALNSITKALLETQVENARLKEENVELRQLLMSRDTSVRTAGAGEPGGGSSPSGRAAGIRRTGRRRGQGGAQVGATPTSSSRRRGTFFGLYAKDQAGSGGSGGEAKEPQKTSEGGADTGVVGGDGGDDPVATGSDDLDLLLHQMHTLLHRQAQDHFLSKDDGICFLNHGSAREMVDSCQAQLEALQRAHAAQGEQLRAAVQGLAQEKEAHSGSRFELQQMQEERRKLEEDMRAFQAENMRLTNEVAEATYLRQEKSDLEDVHNGLNKVLQDQLHQLTVEKMEMQQRVTELERETQRLSNEKEEMAFLEQEKGELERANVELQSELARLRGQFVA